MKTDPGRTGGGWLRPLGEICFSFKAVPKGRIFWRNVFNGQYRMGTNEHEERIRRGHARYVMMRRLVGAPQESKSSSLS